jgi:hypothetical protein
MHKICKDVKLKLIESWKNLLNKIDVRKIELVMLNAKRRVQKQLKREQKRRSLIIRKREQLCFKDCPIERKLKTYFSMYQSGFTIREVNYKIDEVKMWDEPEDEFLSRDYFRKLSIPIDMFPENWWSVATLITSSWASAS